MARWSTISSTAAPNTSKRCSQTQGRRSFGSAASFSSSCFLRTPGGSAAAGAAVMSSTPTPPPPAAGTALKQLTRSGLSATARRESAAGASTRKPDRNTDAFFFADPSGWNRMAVVSARAVTVTSSS
ncbi:unnamed protein product, partial [Pylaiella littoralis]